MKYNRKKQKKTIYFSLIIIFMLSSLNLFYLTGIQVKDTKIDDSIPSDVLQTSAGEGLDPWWNENFRYRRCINLTNPYDQNLTDLRTFIEIDTTDLIPNKMQSDLDDIRIVENGVLRDYYCTLDGDIARIWFKTNISAQTSEYDTYLYYGNGTCGQDSTYYKDDDFGMAWYTFDEDIIGGTVKDSLGKNNATLVGLDTQVGYRGNTPNGQGKSLKFNDTQTVAYIDTPRDVLNGQVSFTICFWAYGGVSGEYLMSFFGEKDANYMLNHAPRASSWSFYVWRRSLTVQEYYDSFPTSQDNAQIYSSPSLGSTLTIENGGFIIAQEQDGSSPGGGFVTSQAYHGYLDDIRFFNYYLSDDELQWIKDGNSISYSLMEERIRAATVNIVVKDVDGRRITDQKATAYLWNYTTGEHVQNSTLGVDGMVEFEDVAYDNYTITVNYTKTLPNSDIRELMVYNSSDEGGPVEYSGLIYTTTLNVDLWTIDFQVTDYEGDPLTLGYIIVNDTNGIPLANLSLDSSGGASFIWDNRSSYHYEVYFINPDINPSVSPYIGTLLNSTTVSRVSNVNIYEVNKENADNPGDFTYEVNKDTFLEGSSLGNPGDNNVIDTKVTFTNMEDNMSSVYILYMDDTAYRSKETKSYLPTIVTDNDEFIYHTAEEETYNVYGVRFEVNGNNQSRCDGIISVTLTYAYIEKVQTNISKLNFIIRDNVYKNSLGGITVKLENQDNIVVTELKTIANGSAYGQVTGLEFWYLREVKYNISLWLTPTQQYDLYVNSSDQMPAEIGAITEYNYTLYSAQTIILDAKITETNFLKFVNGTSEDDPTLEYTWNEEIIVIWIVLNKTENITEDKWDYDDGINTIVSCSFIDVATDDSVYTVSNMTLTTDGNWTLSLNSSHLSAGYQGKSYRVRISAQKYDYLSPDVDERTITINPITTGITLHHYDTEVELSVSPTTGNYYTSEYYGYTLNVSAKYYNNVSTEILIPDTYTYSWKRGASTLYGTLMQHGDYWVLEFDTLDAPETKEYTFTIQIGLENYTRQTIECVITVNDKLTNINGSVDIRYDIYQEIWIHDEKVFYFEYNDSLETQRIGSLDTNLVSWSRQEPDGNETKFSDTNLIELGNKIHMLDLDTENLASGEYSITISIKKNNYISGLITIDLTIKKRPISSGYDNYYAIGDQGRNIRITLNLVDPSNGSIPITGVMINLIIGGQNYSFSETGTPGLYYLYFPTGGYNTFLSPQTIIGTIQMSKENHETTMLPVTLVIDMPKLLGIPIFYLLMIVGAIVAVVASLGVYRYLQIRNIPKFVKKNKAMRKAISSKGKIGDNMLYPTKTEAAIKLLGNKWDDIGLSLGDILGIQEKKRKSMPDMKDKIKEKEGGAI